MQQTHIIALIEESNVCEALEFQHYYEMLYRDDLLINFTADHIVKMTQGNIQGYYHRRYFTPWRSIEYNKQLKIKWRKKINNSKLS